MPKIAVDPVTRIEGHLRIEAQVDGGSVSEAWSSATMFRGMELILRGRDPREAWYWAQRVCGVCTTVHALASVRAVENALGIEVPDNARLIRSIIGAAQNVQDHVIHFYHLHALDWADITLALQADPEATARLAQSVSNYPKSGTNYFRGVLDRLKALAGSGQLSLLASGYWGHPAYAMPPEANLLAVAHYLEALDWQRDVIVIHSILGGKNPHPQSYLVGGMATAMDPNEPDAVIGPPQITALRRLARFARDFVEQAYVPDVIAVAGFYRDWFTRGEGLGNFLAYGDYPDGSINDPARFFFPRGLIFDRDLTRLREFSFGDIEEFVDHSWYEYAGGQPTRKPEDGETAPKYAGPTPPYDFLDTNAKYSWLKAPRLQGRAVEVGPLARMLVAYVSGHERVRALVDGVLGKLGADPTALFSTLGRVAARAIEAQLMAEQIEIWVNQLGDNLANGDLNIFNSSMWNPDTWPKSAAGFGFHEAPRGSLGHWVEIEDKKIRNYQIIAPTTWNGAPRDAQGNPSAYEASLPNTPIADPERPLEILRTIHSFDPCIACGVHVIGPDTPGSIDVLVR